jgi:hypothetical protein
MNHSLLTPTVALAALFLGCHSGTEAVNATAGIQVLPGEESTGQPDAKPRPATAPGIVEAPCESARLLKVRAVERSEARVGGPVAPADDDGTRRTGLATHAIYYLSLDCGGKTYVAGVQRGTPGFQPDDLEAAATLHLRAEGGKIFLKADGGTEFEAVLAAVSLSSSPPGQ